MKKIRLKIKIKIKKCVGNRGDFQHVLVIADIDKKKISNVVRMTIDAD